MDASNDVDLTSFPLLRIDQLDRHEMQTLVDSEAQLTALEQGWGAGVDDSLVDKEAISSIAPFVSKLLDHVRKEISARKPRDGNSSGCTSIECGVVENGVCSRELSNNKGSQHNNASCGQVNSTGLSPNQHIPSTLARKGSVSKATTNESNWKSHQSSDSPKPPSKVQFFVANSPKSKPSNFRSRAKLAKVSLQARAHDNVSRRLNQQRQERTRQALETMQEWRVEREKAKKLRLVLWEEEKRQRRQRRKEKEERAERVRNSMHAAAEEAKSLALQSGCTQEEAFVKAAAAAARVVDDESTMFHTSTADSDESSFENEDDDNIDDGKSLSLNVSFDDVHEDVGNFSATDDFSADKVDCIEQSLTDVLREHALSGRMTNNIAHEMPAVNTVSDERDHTESKTDANFDCSIVRVCNDSSEEVIPLLHDDHGAANECTGPNAISETINIDAISDEKPENQLSSAGNLSIPMKRRTNASLTTMLLKNERIDHSKIEFQEKEIPSKPHSKVNIDTICSKNLSQPTQTRQFSGRRKFCDSFPSFCHIFAQCASRYKPNTVDGKHSRSSLTDTNQKEVSKCMQSQIQRHTMTINNFSDSLEDDSDFDSDGSQHGDACGRFYRIKSRRPEVTSIIRKGFSDRLLSSWDEIIRPDIGDSGNFWNLQWTW